MTNITMKGKLTFSSKSEQNSLVGSTNRSKEPLCSSGENFNLGLEVCKINLLQLFFFCPYLAKNHGAHMSKIIQLTGTWLTETRFIL